jgi:hypothetical protein
MACYGDSFTFLYVGDVRTLQETPMDPHGLLRVWLYFLCVDNVCTSQETPMGLHDLLRE